MEVAHDAASMDATIQPKPGVCAKVTVLLVPNFIGLLPLSLNWQVTALMGGDTQQAKSDKFSHVARAFCNFLKLSDIPVKYINCILKKHTCQLYVGRGQLRWIWRVVVALLPVRTSPAAPAGQPRKQQPHKQPQHTHTGVSCF